MTGIPTWHIAGDWFDNCSCAVACPCTFAQPPDNGFCESVLFWHIQRGHYGDVNLDGLSFVRVGRWEGDLWAGKAKGAAASSSMSAQTSAKGRRFRSFSGAAPVDSPPSGLRSFPKAGRFVEWSAHGSRSRSRPTAPTGGGDRWKGEGVGEGVDGTDEPAGKVSAAHERARLRDRPRPTARDLGQVDGLLRGCVRLQIPVDDEFEQAHPVRLDGPMTGVLCDDGSIGAINGGLDRVQHRRTNGQFPGTES